MALLLSLCLALGWLTGTGLQVDWGTILAGPALTVIFFTVLGLLAFDRSTFKEAESQESWLSFVRLGGVGRLAATALPLVASLGLAISSALSGGLSAAANEAVKDSTRPRCCGRGALPGFLAFAGAATLSTPAQPAGCLSVIRLA